ncbi:MAG: hypothetical protein HKP06_09110 [Flavobacteriaceae bacterium]|nr:hypothetical protein [Flavobacteriaceae bacterium]
MLASNGNNVPVEDKLSPCNNLLASLFRNVELCINGQLLTRSTREYPYREYIKRITQYDTPTGASIKGVDTMSGFLMDEAGKFDDDTAPPVVERKTWIAGSKTCELRGRPCLDFFDNDRCLLPGSDIQLKFYLNDPAFYLLYKKDENPPGYKIILNAAELIVRRITIADSFLNEINSKIKSADAIYPITRRETVAISIPKGSTSFIKENLFRGQLAVRYFFALIDAKAYTGDYTKSPYNFQHFNLREIGLFENGQSVGNNQPLKCDFGEGNKIYNVYYNLLESIGAIGERALACPIGLNEFKNGCTLFCFTRSPDLCHGETHLPYNVGNLTLQLTFDNALTTDIIVLCLGEFDNTVRINGEKNIITDYAV